MKKDGTPGAKLKCRVSDLSLISGQSQQQAPQRQQAPQQGFHPQQQRQQQQQQAQQQVPQNQGDEFEDIPF